MARTSFTLVMLAIAGAMALLLSVSGTLRRDRLRGLAAAARDRHPPRARRSRREIRRLFLRRGLVLAAVGVALGLGGAAVLTRLMQSLLFGVGPLDPVTFVVTPLVLAAVAVLATYLPARRAAAVDPVETLRAE